MPQKLHVLFDTDPGVDDALALLFLHRHPDVELHGITTVAGNGTIETVTRNACYLVQRFGIAAPVARGAARPLRGELHPPPVAIHGDDALGGIGVAPDAAHSIDVRPAHRLLIDAIRRRPNEMTLVAVGMLTNLALAIEADPGIVPLVRNVVIMGGAFGTSGRSGNVRPGAEANVFGDPFAADIVCTAAWPLTVVGLDVTEEIVMTSAFLARLRDQGGAEGRCMWELTRRYAEFHARRNGLDGIYAHDPAAAVCALAPELFRFRRGPIRVATAGIAAGATIQKPEGRAFPPSAWDDAPPQSVALGVDAQAVLATFASAFVTAGAAP